MIVARLMSNDLRERAYNLLRWSERYTKTDMVYLASGGFWLTLKTIGGILIALSVSVAFANLLPKETYGEYKYIFSIFGLLAITTLIGMGTAVTKSVAQGYDGTTTRALKQKMLWGMFGSVAAAGIALYYFIQGNMGLAGAFGLITVFLPFVDTLSLFNTVLTGKRLFRESMFFELTIQFVASAVLIGSMFVTDQLVYILATYFLAYTIARLIAFKIVIRQYTDNDNADPSAISYGKKLSSMEILGVVAETVDSILLWQFVGPAPVAIYAFAKGIPTQMSSAMQRLMTLAFPKFAARDFASIKQTLGERMLKLFLIMAAIVTAYFFAAPYIFALLFPQYMEAVVYTQIYSLILLLFPLKLIGTVFQAHAHTKALFATSTFSPLVRITLAVILIPTFGIPGAIGAELGARVFNGALTFYQYSIKKD